MAVKIRLRRMGQKKNPFYRIVVADSRSPRDGKCIEEIGTYDPTKDPSEFHVNEELAKKWLANGAQPTDTVSRIFRQPVSRNNRVRKERGVCNERISGSNCKVTGGLPE